MENADATQATSCSLLQRCFRPIRSSHNNQRAKVDRDDSDEAVKGPFCYVHAGPSHCSARNVLPACKTHFGTIPSLTGAFRTPPREGKTMTNEADDPRRR